MDFQLFTKWWFWLICLVAGVVYMVLFSSRSYKTEDGKLLVRHGILGKWVDLRDHLRDEHPIDKEEEKKK